MKKLTCSVALLILQATAINAQTQAGLKAGINISRISGFVGNSSFGIHAGGYLNFILKNNWQLRPELIYSCEGQRYNPDEDERVLKLGYVEMPLMLRYIIGTRTHTWLETGPQAGVLVHAMDKGSAGDKANVKRSLSNTVFSWNAGLGIPVNRQLSIYARYSFGLSDITLYGMINAHNNVGQIGITLRLE